MEEILEALIVARGLRPYYELGLGALQPVLRPGLGTIAVDKHWRLYVDPEWFHAQTPRHRAGVIACHEIEHLLREHMKLALPLLALDLAINDDVDPADDLLPPGGCYPKNFGLPDGQTEEWYADHLPESAQEGTCSGGSGAGQQLLDELPVDDETVPGLSAAEAETLKDRVADAVQDYVAKGKGVVPAGIVVWAKERVAARAARPTSWQALLRLAVQRLLRSSGAHRGDHHTWKRLGRRSTEQRLLPARRTPPLTLGCIVDTSGSMAAEGGVVLAEAAALLQSVVGQGGRVRWVVADAEVTHDAWRPPTQWTGGGGTDLRVAFAALTRQRVDAVVVLTDGETPWPDTAPPWPVVVATTTTSAGPTWATTVQLKGAP